MSMPAYQNPPQWASSPGEVPKRSKRGFWWALGIFVVGAGSSIVLFVIALMSTLGPIGDYARTEIPGQVEFTVDKAETYRIYLENQAQNSSDVKVRVQDDTGVTIVLDQPNSSVTYATGGHDGKSVWAFAPHPGHYTLQVVGTPVQGGTVAVGPSIGAGLALGIVGPILLGFGSFVVALIILVVTLVRRSRSGRQGPPSGGYPAPGAQPYPQSGAYPPPVQ